MRMAKKNKYAAREAKMQVNLANEKERNSTLGKRLLELQNNIEVGKQADYDKKKAELNKKTEREDFNK